MAKQESIDTKMERIAKVAKSVAITLADIERRMKILDLTLTYHWFDEISAGRKKEEYRDITPFWKSRLEQPFDGETTFKKFDAIRFRRGRYGKTTMVVKCRSIYIGYGRPEWGAPEDKEVFVIQLGDILEKKEA